MENNLTNQLRYACQLIQAKEKTAKKLMDLMMKSYESTLKHKQSIDFFTGYLISGIFDAFTDKEQELWELFQLYEEEIIRHANETDRN